MVLENEMNKLIDHFIRKYEMWKIDREIKKAQQFWVVVYPYITDSKSTDAGVDYKYVKRFESFNTYKEATAFFKRMKNDTPFYAEKHIHLYNRKDFSGAYPEECVKLHEFDCEVAMEIIEAWQQRINGREEQ